MATKKHDPIDLNIMEEDTVDASVTMNEAISGAQSTKRKEYSKAEATAYNESLKTSGRKGLKLQRINMSFSDTNFEYISIMSGLNAMTKAQYVNMLIDRDRSQKDNKEAFEYGRKQIEKNLKKRK